jgi:DNA topoisomerase-1
MARSSARLAPHPTSSVRLAHDAPAEPEQETARAAGLRYIHDSSPGIRRKRAGRAFAYYAPSGERITDRREIERIRKLGIPPAWTDVWICPNPNCHLQATGRDAKGRKQYRYHPRWASVRAETKYQHSIAFGETLPRIRERVERDLALPGLPREKALAAIVSLLDETAIRVGNEEYARANESYGLTTLRNEHVSVEGATLRFCFRGKSGKEHEVEAHDQRVARIVRKMEGLPGQRLFEYKDENGEVHAVESADVNEYLREISGEDFTAKDFRTWSGSVVALRALTDLGAHDAEAEARRRIAAAMRTVAERLGNTPAISRKSYVHPAILDAYVAGALAAIPSVEAQTSRDHSGLESDEQALLDLLRASEALAKTGAKAS